VEKPNAVFDAAQIVKALYRGLLRREAEPDGLHTYTTRLSMSGDLESLLRDFIQSDEYRRTLDNPLVPSYPLDGAPPMSLETVHGATAHRALWQHIASVWSEYGRREPYWSVVAHDRWRATNIADEQDLSAFFATGEGERERLDAWLKRNALSCSQDGVCAEYGCGVGRITTFLAGRFRRVIAFDVSDSHLDAARRHLEGKGISNVEFVLVRGEDDLRRLSGVDVFYSILVLQHNPPPIMIDILNHAFSGLKTGGVAFLQIPTYSKDYSFSLARYLDQAINERTMEMHFLPQRSILELGRIYNVFPVEIQPDWCIGNHERWISSTFLMTKRDPGQS
jgi:SAM-dependent methyltransferase